MTKSTQPKQPKAAAKPVTAPPPAPVSKLDQLAALLTKDGGASLAEMVAATSWQAHSVRGAMAGALKKKRGLAITSRKLDGVRLYSAQRAD